MVTSSRLRCALTALLVVVLASLGCGRAGFVEPVTSFQEASSVVIASTRLYLTELNKIEREHYLTDQASKKLQIKLPELEAVQVFSQEGLKARLDALDQLARYGALLSRLAKSDAPERVKAEAETLGTSLRDLTETVNTLNGDDDKAFKNAVGPAAALIGEVLNLVVEQRLREALKAAVERGEAPVNRLVAAIGSDLVIAYERKRNLLSNLRVAFVDQYNVEQQKPAPDLGRLRALADQVRAHEDRWEVFASANPATGLDAMRDAHTALVSYARSAGRVTDLASLVEAMEAFSARARRLGQAVVALQEL
jgi:predicted DNA-binding ribbon-helix-helix protein